MSTAVPEFATTDLCDAHEDRLRDGRLRVAPPPWIALGALARFAGPAVTLRVPDDNSLVRAALETPGAGRVLVVDGGASLRCALLGGNLGRLGERNGWSGVIVNGCARDADELDGCRLGVRALALHPRRSDKRGLGERDVPLAFAGLTVRPGDWIYADRDGWLVASEAL
ncbi:MAG TPA: ribonuclease E activity regulator RraA [Burkholderiaceae bacterium]|nr:ribonuclease E activity regulator RraA [Burkholderiaceae bacterium]